MTVAGILTAIVIGAVLGVLGRLLAPGEQHIPIWLTVVVGIVAALVGTAVVGSLRDTDGIDWVELVVQLVLAAVGVVIAARLYPSRART
ncbi:GlsB/YeaQ/YmgE family stress response membrane protein [Nocardioides anomalus]|uniref:GlsB/YeaQ/YmgE family stress response membrane protein n=1 Tax=Nocardioides anomalus TaxID=2712223 RepID=A0A6G6WIK1_9ACTN|nr:GlsB/YeaQ/YmgE family stress response membrane protein [Nocardioides anomalus]QIG44973.1 GlsB/YeaQ/YmgE family stress response membrane protein [Nocardioides anomalus]